MRRRTVYLVAFLVAIIALSAAGYTAWWFSAAGKVREEIVRWALERRAAGWQVEVGEPEIGGFPLKIDVRIGAAQLADAGGSEAWTWELPAIRAWAAPWRPQRVHVSAPGLHQVNVGDDRYEIRTRQADGDLTADTRSVRVGEIRFADISVRRNAEPQTIRADGLRLRLERTILPATESGDSTPAGIDASAPALAAESASGDGVGVALKASRIRLPAEWKTPLGPLVESVSLDAVLTGLVEPRGELREALARWRDSGGVVEIQSVSVDWQALRLRAAGTFALDEELQPQGAATAEIAGIDKTADALIAAGVIDARTAFAAKVANQALTVGGRPVRLPLTIQQQKLFLGPVPLLKLKTFDWE